MVAWLEGILAMIHDINKTFDIIGQEFRELAQNIMGCANWDQTNLDTINLAIGTSYELIDDLKKLFDRVQEK
jgi:hypothetical protein